MARRLAAIDPAHQTLPRTMSRRRTLAPVALACIILALSFPLRTNAIEWGAEPAIGIGYEYNDNIFLTTLAHEAVNGFTLTPSLDLSARQETWELRSSTQLTDRRYLNRSDLDADNGTTSLTYSYRTERNQFQLNGAYTNEATWTSSHIDPDIGLTQTNTRRATTLAKPTWSWYATETAKLNLDYQWTAVTYENGLANRLLDYQQRTPSLTLTNQISPRTNLTVALAYAEFQVTTPQDQVIQNPNIPVYTSKSRSNYAQFGISYAIDETLKGNLMAGPRRTVSTEEVKTSYDIPCPPPFVGLPGCYELRFAPQTNTTQGTVFSGSLESSLELTHTKLDFSRTVDSSGSGSQVQVGNVNIRIDRQLTQDRLSAWFEVNGYLFKALSAGTTNQDRHYYQLTPGLRWRWTEYLSLDTSYRYQRQRYVGQDDYANSNAFYVSLTYRWPKFSVSR